MRRYIAVIAFAGLACLAAPVGAHAAAIGLTPGKQSATVGDQVVLDVLAVLGSDAALGLGGFDVTISYDSSRLQLDAYALGTLLGATDGVESDDFSFSSGPGLLSLSQLSYLSPAALASLQSPAGGGLALATLSFTALAPGVAGVAVLQAILASADGGPLEADLGKSAGVSIAEPAPAPVPEPASLILLGSGLAAIAARRRVRRHAMG